MANHEIEVKILEVNEDAISQKLLDLGAKKVFDGELDAIYYDKENEAFRKCDERIRLRKRGDYAEFTFKRKVSNETVKIEEEYQVRVDDFDGMRRILEELGVVEIRRYQKQRRTWVLNDMVFEFDFLWDGVPVFMEIEGPTEAKVLEWVDKLGFSRDEAKSWSGSDVLRHYDVEPVEKMI